VRERIIDAVESGDLDELLRIIDALCETREWELLIELRDRARRALERGRQLWPAASHAEYRLALDAPAAPAASVVVEDAGRFAIGPLAEVAASTHTWAELAPHATPGPVAALVAHERVVRGEEIDASTVAHAEVLGVPLRLARWEPRFALATYRPDRVEAPPPDLPPGRVFADPLRSSGSSVESSRPRGDAEVTGALRDLVRGWTASSEGRARVTSVEGDAGAALAALDVAEAGLARLEPAEAIALLAWAGASGGHHGRRRGAAAGRDLAWAAAGALAGFDRGVARTRPVG